MRKTTRYDLELGAVVSLSDWRHYLYGTKFTVITISQEFASLLDQKELNMRQRRWLELLSDYDCDIRYHPGKANVVADALSRKEREPPLRVRALVMTISLDLPKQILNAQTEARKLENIKKEDVGGMLIENAKFPEPLYLRFPNGSGITSPWILSHGGKSSKSSQGYDTIWVIVDNLTNVCVVFHTIRETESFGKLVKNVPEGGGHETWNTCLNHFVIAVPRFSHNFWRSLSERFGDPKLDMSTAYSYNKLVAAKRDDIQTLEDMLRACGIDFGKGWVNHLPLVEFSYNNSYHASIKAAPFEALYGRKCRLPVCWSEVEEAQILGPELIQETTEGNSSRSNKGCKSCSGPIHFGKRGKLNLGMWGPFKVIERVGEVAYKLELLEELSRVHNTFHVSNLKKCHADEPLAVPLDGLILDDKLHFFEEPIEIVDREVKRLKRSRIPLVKVRWNPKRGPEFTLGAVIVPIHEEISKPLHQIPHHRSSVHREVEDKARLTGEVYNTLCFQVFDDVNKCAIHF
ncbi:putative reverse transcriptase domain-containing protein [Tanacetum coccineum]